MVSRFLLAVYLLLAATSAFAQQNIDGFPPLSSLTGKITTGQLGTTLTPQFTAVGLGTPAAANGLIMNQARAGGGIGSTLTGYINANQTLTGTADGANVAYGFTINDDRLNAGTGSANYLYGFWVKDALTTPVIGGRVAFQANLNLDNGISATNATPFFVASAGIMTIDAIDSSAAGQIFGANFAARVRSASATGLISVTGLEVDTTIQANAGFRVGEQIVIEAANTGKGTTFDAALVIAMQPGATNGFVNGITFGDPRGINPIATTGTMISSNITPFSGTVTVGTVMDFRNTTITNNLLIDSNFAISGAGLITITTPSMTNALKIGQDSNTLGFGAITFSGGTSDAADSGIFGGGSSSLFVQASTGGAVVLRVLATALVTAQAAGTTINSGTFGVTNITTGTNQDVVCMSSANVFLIQAATSCTISSMRFKRDIEPIAGMDPLSLVMSLRPRQFYMKDGDQNKDQNAARLQVGLIAEDVEALDPRLAIYEDDMKTPKSWRLEGMIAVLAGAIQEQQREIAELRAR